MASLYHLKSKVQYNDFVVHHHHPFYIQFTRTEQTATRTPTRHLLTHESHKVQRQSKASQRIKLLKSKQ